MTDSRDRTIRVDVRSRRAWLTEAAYEEVLACSTKLPYNQIENTPFSGVIGGYEHGTVILYQAPVDKMPPPSDYVVETDAQGLCFYVDWLNNGKPFENPLVPPPNGVRRD